MSLPTSQVTVHVRVCLYSYSNQFILEPRTRPTLSWVRFKRSKQYVHTRCYRLFPHLSQKDRKTGNSPLTEHVWRTDNQTSHRKQNEEETSTISGSAPPIVYNEFSSQNKQRTVTAKKQTELLYPSRQRRLTDFKNAVLLPPPVWVLI